MIGFTLDLTHYVIVTGDELGQLAQGLILLGHHARHVRHSLLHLHHLKLLITQMLLDRLEPVRLAGHHLVYFLLHGREDNLIFIPRFLSALCIAELSVKLVN